MNTMDLSQRSNLPERMDAPDLPWAEYRAALADLARLNRLTLTHPPVLEWLAAGTRKLGTGARISVLDVACGHGDLLRSINRWATKRGLKHTLTGLDMNPRSIAEAAAATSRHMTISWVTGDVFATTPEAPQDFIVSSQFAHHLTDDEVIALMQWMDRHSTRGWFIIDPHRHWFPYYGFRFLARLMGWHPIVREDGTISVARSFRPREWRALVARAGLPAKVRRVFPFRISVSRLK